MEKSRQFQCPHCQTVLAKTDSEQVLGEAGSFVVFGASHRPCASCHQSIDRLEIIRGTYDPKLKAGGMLGCMLIGAGFIALVLFLLFAP
jgi:hypothetical protein